MKEIIKILALVVLFGLISSCEKERQAEIPAYLSIGRFTVTDTSGKTVSSHIPDAWVYIDDKFKGVFELPTRLPVLEKGMHRVDIRAGVNENGIYDLKVNYPFYEVYSEMVNFKDEEVHHIDPVISYSDHAEINSSWSGADFEGGINFNPSYGTDTFFVQTPNNTGKLAYGNFVGTYYLTADDNFFEAHTDAITDIPRNHQEVWMEMDYKSDATVTVGLYMNGLSKEMRLVHFKPQENWTKVYIKLSMGILNYPHSPDYSFFIRSSKDNQLPTSVTSIDNVKLLHF